MMMKLSEMRKTIAQFEETKHLQVNDVDVNKVYQYIVQKQEEPIKDGYEIMLKTDPYIEIYYRPTKEKSTEIRKRKMRQNLKFYDSEVYIQDASLSEFDCYNSERVKAFETAQHFLDNFTKEHFEQGMYIHGQYGTGKSYLLSAIAQDLAQRGITVLFVYMPDLTRSLKQGMNDGNLEERVNKLKQADVLMMDDFGGENVSTWFRDEILIPVLQYRLSAKLPVFMSSNYSHLQLLDILTLVKDESGRSKAGRLIQRLKDLMIYIKLTEIPFKH
jgi:primosomal protein DnaI